MNSIEDKFEDYTNSCLDDLLPLQDAFTELYDLDSYEAWYYNHGIGVFEFKSKSGKNLYFKYVDIGSFSTTTNTWNWSWNNASTPALVRKGLKRVKEFGELNNFEQLTVGLIDGDQYTGWAMTAIAVKLLNAIGSYRIPQEHLFIYFLFTNELSEDEYQRLKEKYVECDKHTGGRLAFVCQHLIQQNKLGFHEAFETDESEPLTDPDDDYQAWCDECEKVRLKAGEWTDAAMEIVKIKIVCDECYFEIKKRNQND